MLIVFGALKIELDNTIRSMNILKKTRKHGVRLYWGDRKGRNILIVLTGMGRDSAIKAVDMVFQQKTVEEAEDIKVLITGFCGAAGKDLVAGDVVAYKRVLNLTGINDNVENKGGRILPYYALPQDEIIQKIRNEIRAVTCGCTDRVISSPEGKRAVNNKYGVEVIDMESYWIIGRLLKNGLPVNVVSCVRSVSDDIKRKLPLYFSANTLKDTFFKFLKSIFISIFSGEEFRVNIVALRNIRKAKRKLNKTIFEIIG